ncbi:MAG: hypothetical protein J6T99_03650 [Oscillospiraceae bacterium]|nr:hypothetical protein [Oscillospiraceae bacterium]
MKEENKVIMMRFDRKVDPIKRSVDTMMVRKYMELRNNGLLYESLFPAGTKTHPDIYYDFDSYMWRAVRPDGEMSQGDLRSMVWFFTGLNVKYRYELNGEEKKTNMFETVVRDAVENPETFSIVGFQEDYSYQECTYLRKLCEKLIASRHGERYQGAKLAQWMNG